MAGRAVAIDIGSRIIHVVEGYQKGNTVEIAKLARLSTPANSFIEGKIEDRQALRETIRTGLSQSGIKCRNVIISMQGSSIITRELTLPEVEQGLLQGMVNYEMEQYIPDDIKGYAVEYRQVGSVTEGGTRKLRIRAAAIPKDVVREYHTMLEELKLNPVALDIHINAISKLFSGPTEINCIDRPGPDKIIALIDFGHRNTIVTIISNGTTVFSRSVSYGSRDLDTAIAGCLDIQISNAEQRKFEELKLNRQDMRAEEREKGIGAAVGPILQQWITEIQKVFQYYASRNQQNNPSAVYLYGGGGRLQELPEYMKQQLGVSSVSRIRSLGNVSFKNKSDECDIDEFINAIGAIIRLR